MRLKLPPGAGLKVVTNNISTDSTDADFITSGALTCGAATQGKMRVHTTPLQYCDNAGTPVLQYAAYANSSGGAKSLASATTTVDVSAATAPNRTVEVLTATSSTTATWQSPLAALDQY